MKSQARRHGGIEDDEIYMHFVRWSLARYQLLHRLDEEV